MQRHFVNYNEIPLTLGAVVPKKQTTATTRKEQLRFIRDGVWLHVLSGKMFTAFEENNKANETNKPLKEKKFITGPILGQDELFAEELCLVLENEKIWYNWWHRTGYNKSSPLTVAQMMRFLELRVPSMKHEIRRVNENVMNFVWDYFKERYAESTKSYNGTL